MRRSGASDAYRQLLEKVRWSNQHGRDVFHLQQSDIDLARLFAYGYRAQTIGAFHATRTALENVTPLTNPDAHRDLTHAMKLLVQLEDEAVQAVPQDFRAAVSTLSRYDQWTTEALESMESAMVLQPSPELATITRLFESALSQVAGGNGLYIATDTHTPDQGAFRVPNLKITIVPLIYGDFHSWNFAFLMGDQIGVPVHRHRAGVEVHLGFSPVNGATVLGDCEAEVHEAYAMPIPPGVNHGFHNKSGHDHILPFVFGSLARGGWGIFFDVEPFQQTDKKRQPRELETSDMNYSVRLDEAIERMKESRQNTRETFVPAQRTSTPETGGLELSAMRIADSGMDITSSSFRIMTVVRGRGSVRVGSAEARVAEHEYFGVPANVAASITQVGDDPLVALDALMLPHVAD